MIIAELGFNHLGNLDIANQYVDALIECDVDAITFQVRETEHRAANLSLYLNDDSYKNLFLKIKNSGKKLGVALADTDYVSFFENLDVDFYKVIRNDISNKKLINLLMMTGKQIFVSTGMSSKKDIENFISFIDQSTKKRNQFKLVHTQLSNALEDCNLKSIQEMKEYGLDVAYGHHCGDVTAIFMALCYNPSDLLFYVKGSPAFQYTEDSHAIQIDQIQDLIKKIHRYNGAVGTGVKMSMNNKIENPE
jgi:sialic acid synthase SpsE